MFLKNTSFFKLATFINLFVIFQLGFYAQSNKDLNRYYDEFDQYNGVENSELYIGSLYNKKYRTFDKSHPFYTTYDYIEGTIFYNNQFFQNHFKYDVYNDLIIVKYIDNEKMTNISLISERINSFSLGEDIFIRLDYHEDLKRIYRNGFFETVYSGELYHFYIKHTKIYQNKIIFNSERNQFMDQNIYVLKYNERYYEFKNKKDLLNLLPNRNEEIDSFFVRDTDLSKETLYQFLLKIDKPEAK